MGDEPPKLFLTYQVEARDPNGVLILPVETGKVAADLTPEDTLIDSNASSGSDTVTASTSPVPVRSTIGSAYWILRQFRVRRESPRVFMFFDGQHGHGDRHAGRA
jgi:hypothetical protein